MRHRIAPLLLGIILAGCASSKSAPPKPLEGLASWYGEEMSGRATANGEIFDPRSLSAAHRSFPFGTLVEVVNVVNGRSVTVRINDRGPFIDERIIDLSWAAANEIDMLEAGVVPVRLRVVSQASEGEPPRPFVVKVKTPSRLIEIPRIPEDPPAIPFPLPDTVGDAETPDRPRAGLDEVVAGEDIIVVEERDGTEIREIVSNDGSTLVGVAAPPPEPETISVEPLASARAETIREEARNDQNDEATEGEPYWVVQIGAFRNRENADRLASRASELGERIMIVEMSGTLRVHVGPFLTREEAIAARERLDDAGFDTLVMER